MYSLQYLFFFSCNNHYSVPNVPVILMRKCVNLKFEWMKNYDPKKKKKSLILKNRVTLMLIFFGKNSPINFQFALSTYKLDP